MDEQTIKDIREKMEHIHNNIFPKVVEFKNNCKFPFELLEDDLITKIQNHKLFLHNNQ